jgi:hypothetical protein
VERLWGSAFPDRLVGNALPHTLVGEDRNDKLSGLTGDDRLEARDGISDQLVDCGTGNDVAASDAGDPGVNCETPS